MPLEILWQILKDAAVMSSTAPDSGVDFPEVLTSLSLVCRLFRSIVSDPDWIRGFKAALFATGEFGLIYSTVKYASWYGTRTGICRIAAVVDGFRRSRRKIAIYVQCALSIKGANL